MIYFDICTKGFQWLNPGTPAELFTQNADAETRLKCKCKGNYLNKDFNLCESCIFCS